MTPEAVSYFLQLTDRRSKRRFAMRLDSEDQFPRVGTMLDYIGSLTPEDIQKLIGQEKLGALGAQGLADMQTILFDVDNEGNLSDRVKGSVIKQRGRPLKSHDPFKFEHRKTGKKDSDIYVADLIVDRDNSPFMRNWDGFYVRKWNENPQFRGFVQGVIKDAHGDDAERILAMETTEDKLAFLNTMAGAIFEAPYELYSRFIGRKIRFRNGPETVLDGNSYMGDIWGGIERLVSLDNFPNASKCGDCEVNPICQTRCAHFTPDEYCTLIKRTIAKIDENLPKIRALIEEGKVEGRHFYHKRDQVASTEERIRDYISHSDTEGMF